MAVTFSGLLMLLPHVMRRLWALRRGRGPVRSVIFEDVLRSIAAC